MPNPAVTAVTTATLPSAAPATPDRPLGGVAFLGLGTALPPAVVSNAYVVAPAASARTWSPSAPASTSATGPPPATACTRPPRPRAPRWPTPA